MFKPTTIQRVQSAVNLAAQIIGQQEEGKAAASSTPGEPMQSHYERQSLTLSLASLLLEEDDRQNRTLIIPARA